ncbi:hypothetical protein GW17_00004519 [Ensete ventricosum]|nr:hypothetical protein GW17_00004519 [Ensete ventricosum]
MPSGLTFPLPLSSRINGGNVHLVSPPYLRPPRESPRSASSTPSIPPPFPTSSSILSANPVMGDRVVQDLLAELERAKQLAREERRKAGIALDGEDEDEEDYMGFVPLIEKLGKMKVKDSDSIDRFWVPTDSESDDDEKFSPDEVKKRLDEFEKKCKRHSELFKNFAVADSSDKGLMGIIFWQGLIIITAHFFMARLLSSWAIQRTVPQFSCDL